jgi:butyryl-CoA dehydrogenase
MSIYEGTTGIQSLDLLGRKVNMEKGQALQELVSAIQQTIQSASAHEALKPYAASLGEELKRAGSVLAHLGKFAAAGEVDRYLADASVFMEQVSYLVIGWQWLKQGTHAATQLQSGNTRQQTKAFYEGKVHTMKFFFRYELPHAAACAKTLLDPEYLTNLKSAAILP